MTDSNINGETYMLVIRGNGSKYELESLNKGIDNVLGNYRSIFAGLTPNNANSDNNTYEIQITPSGENFIVNSFNVGDSNLITNKSIKINDINTDGSIKELFESRSGSQGGSSRREKKSGKKYSKRSRRILRKSLKRRH
jgi:hypothetical protein